MEKIKALLERAGCKKDLIDQIAASLDSYKTTVREEYDKEYATKVEQAKKVCIEETEAHKRELARRVQIFCETKSAAIEAQLAKKSALNESEAESRLQNIKDLLEGVQPSGSQNSEVTAALKQAVRVANEERKKAVEAANQRVAIAEKALKQNRALATENAKLKERLKNVVSESRQPNRQQRQRIDGSRQQQARPSSTRPTLFENQDRRPPQKRQDSHVTNTNKGYGINEIAQSMESDLI